MVSMFNAVSHAVDTPSGTGRQWCCTVKIICPSLTTPHDRMVGRVILLYRYIIMGYRYSSTGTLDMRMIFFGCADVGLHTVPKINPAISWWKSDRCWTLVNFMLLGATDYFLYRVFHNTVDWRLLGLLTCDVWRARPCWSASFAW